MTIKNFTYFKIHFKIKIIGPYMIEDDLVILEDSEIDAVAAAVFVIKKEYGYTEDSIVSMSIVKSGNVYTSSKDRLNDI